MTTSLRIHREYFSLRINVSKTNPLTKIAEFLESIPGHKLACFEKKDKHVTNPHTHIIIWGDDKPSYNNNAQDFRDALQTFMPGTKANSRYAIRDEELPGDFWSACKYICKGYKETLPIIFHKSDWINDIMIEEAWREYWSHNLASISRQKQDDSMTNVERMLTKYKDEFDKMKNEDEIKESDASDRFDYFAVWWYWRLKDFYKLEKKSWNNGKVKDILDGILLQLGDSDEFDKRNMNIILKGIVTPKRMSDFT